ncbi:UPF0166 protein [Streptosporangium violaceochromogenes]|nr:UPF0166 protein [Streptosporangium violaceochromogenes]
MANGSCHPPRPPSSESADIGTLGDPLFLCRLTITLLNGTLWHRRPLYSEIVRRAHAYGLAGAGVFFGIEGFVAEGAVHTTRILSLSDRLPIMIVILDEKPRIHGFVQELEPEMEIESAVVEHVRALRLRRPSRLTR